MILFKHIKLYFKIQKLNIKSIFEYRYDFMITSILTIISQCCNLMFLAIIYGNIPTIDGWKMWEIILLYSFLLFTEGIINIFFHGIWRLPELINEGGFDLILLRPVPISLQIYTAKIDLDGFNKIIISIALFVLSITKCEILWTISKVAVLVYMLVCGCILRVTLVWCGSCLTFWMGSSKNNLSFFLISLGEVAKYPLSIYPKVFGFVFTLIPYAYINYYPTQYVLDKGIQNSVIISFVAVTFISILLSLSVFKMGLGIYESTGN